MSHRLLRRLGAAATVLGLVALSPLGASGASADDAPTYTTIEGSGSTWSSNAIDQWRRDIKKSGITVNYNATGSTAGRTDFAQGLTDFGVTEVPYQFHPTDGSSSEQISRPYALMPIVAGGTSFMYHLEVAGKQVTNLRLSPETITKIFTGVITNWSDPLITADYGVQLPDKPITPLVRSDGSGTSAQFSLYMSTQFPDLWTAFCAKVGRGNRNCGQTSLYPGEFGAAKALSGSIGVASYISASYGDGAIGYVEYSYALNAGYPVVKVKNAAGYYVEPTAYAVAVALQQAKIDQDASNPDTYLTQDLRSVYTDGDARSYPLSSYSYMILPTATSGRFDTNKGYTLADFAYYFLCQGQRAAPALGYSPLPVNLVQAGFDQVLKIPGVDPQNKRVQDCDNPTFNPDGSNRLADLAPQPASCDQAGQGPCTGGTGGAASTGTTLPPAPAAGPGATPGAPAAGGGTDPGSGGGPAPGQGGGTANDPGAPAAGPAGPAAPGATPGAAPTIAPAVSIPAGSTVNADGSVSKGGKVVAPAGSVAAQAGSTVQSDGTIKQRDGTVISGVEAVTKARAIAAQKAGSAAGGAATGGAQGAGTAAGGGVGLQVDAATGTTASGGLDVGAGTLGGVAPVAATVALGPAVQGGTMTVLFVLASVALVGVVLVPPLLARRNQPEESA